MDPIICTRIPVEFVKSIDAWASAQRITRPEALRRLIEKAVSIPRQSLAEPGAYMRRVKGKSSRQTLFLPCTSFAKGAAVRN
jgi:hypothetical protein